MRKAALLYAAVCLSYGVIEAAFWSSVLIWFIGPFFQLGHQAPEWVFPSAAAAFFVVALCVIAPKAYGAVSRLARSPVPPSFTAWRFLLAIISAFTAVFAVASSSLYLRIIAISVALVAIPRIRSHEAPTNG